MDNTQPIRIHRASQPRIRQVQAIQRRFALYLAGKTQRDIAAELNISFPAVSQAINGYSTSRPVAEKLAEITGKPLHELWPDGRYDSGDAA
ncbi:helix-turn-helix domain-containing protein [Thiothrix nivea]|uniref:Helix-turn-helix domain protein n=1 Tax=Thiothrix nivea (strain ATCC 35100 / DSM 5205 / JP2) TaxID=870187 RepID=A0A656HAS0_THINJ|nr:helix-turn-helix transcriptional regulator [Thiothrix nivea]EIJ33333.1 helix-turn-helix domain protein [Thiothrix nivea DSM 5205]